MPSTLIVISYALLVLPIQQVFGYEALYDFHSHQVTHHGAMGKRNFKMFASDYLPPGVDTAQLLRRRGYVAQQHYVTTSDGYVLSLVRGTNPLINEGLGCKKGKKPILFIHGPLVSAPVWLANSANVWPRDFSSLNISLLGMELLELTLSNEPSTNSLPFLAMNFGHEVWMFNGRGTLESQNEIGRRNRTLLDAVADLVPSLLGGGFGMQPLVDIRGPKVHEAEIVEHHELGTEHHHVGPHHLGSHDVGHQELGYHDGEHYIVRRSGANNHHYHHQAHQAHQAPRNTLFDFIRPLINMPAALLDYGNFFERLLNTFDAQFWSYSMDEQAEFDFPAALDYVLSSSGQDKAAVVAHSNGAAMVLMGASTKPHLAHKSEFQSTGRINRSPNQAALGTNNNKPPLQPVAKTVLFAPALNMGNSFVNNLLPLITPLIQSYLGPIPFGFMSQQLESIVQALCDTQMKQQFICEDVADLLFGPSNNQAPIVSSTQATETHLLTNHLLDCDPKPTTNKLQSSSRWLATLASPPAPAN